MIKCDFSKFSFVLNFRNKIAHRIQPNISWRGEIILLDKNNINV